MVTKLLKFETMYGKFEYALAILSGLIVVFMMFFQTASVALRMVTGKTIPSVNEAIALFFVACVFLGISYVQGQKEHISIEIIVEKLPQKIKFWVTAVGYVIAISIIFIITSQIGLNAWDALVTKNFTMGIVRIPLWPAHACVFIGMFVLSIRLVLDFMLHLCSKNKPITQHQVVEEDKNVNT